MIAAGWRPGDRVVVRYDEHVTLHGYVQDVVGEEIWVVLDPTPSQWRNGGEEREAEPWPSSSVRRELDHEVPKFFGRRV